MFRTNISSLSISDSETDCGALDFALGAPNVGEAVAPDPVEEHRRRRRRVGEPPRRRLSGKQRLRGGGGGETEDI